MKKLNEKAPLVAHPSLMSSPGATGGDTALVSSSSSSSDALTRLHNMLKAAKIKDDELVAGVKLTDSGYQKAAARLGVSADEIKVLFRSLISKLRQDSSRENDLMMELDGSANGRFSMESDFLGNVTIRDANSGKKVFVRGGEAATLMKQAKGADGASLQNLLGRYSHLMESDADHNAARRRTGFWGKTGAGCIFLAKSTNRLLLAHRSSEVEQPDTWGCWGGAIDDGEDPLDAVLREAKEETGFNGQIDHAYPLFVYQKRSFKYHNFLIVIEEEFTPRLDHENQGFRWCDFGDWPFPLHFGIHALFGDPNSVETMLHVIKENENTGSINESVEESFDDELSGKSSGSYNFPWRKGSEHGFGNARWTGQGHNMRVRVQWAADANGDQISDKKMLEEIQNQAIAYIGQE